MGEGMEDVFAGCDEATARANLRYDVYEWAAEAELGPGLRVTLAICWDPLQEVPLAEHVAAARKAWNRVMFREPAYRREAADEVNKQYRWMNARADEMLPYEVFFLPDGSVDIYYGGVETGGHGFVAEISAEGKYLGYRVE